MCHTLALAVTETQVSIGIKGDSNPFKPFRMFGVVPTEIAVVLSPFVVVLVLARPAAERLLITPFHERGAAYRASQFTADPRALVRFVF